MGILRTPALRVELWICGWDSTASAAVRMVPLRRAAEVQERRTGLEHPSRPEEGPVLAIGMEV